MLKKRVALIFGGENYEHEVSIRSCKSVMEKIDTQKYIVDLIYIDRKGGWYFCSDIDDLDVNTKLENIEILKTYDVLFPLLHGDYGEDGKIQGLFEMMHMPYVGCNVVSSAVCMDKDFTKRILKAEGISIVPYLVVTKDMPYKKLAKKVRRKIGYPCFVKPCSKGSSIGICKVMKKEDLENAVKEALYYDEKVLIEKYIKGRELEIAVLGKEQLTVSNVGEIFSGEDFYSYHAKYNCDASVTKVPTKLGKKTDKKLKQTAQKVYRLLGCSGLSRVDFFLSKAGKIYVNEINTMPGFTSISMYPVLIEEKGISFSKLIDILLKDAQNKSFSHIENR